MENASKFLLMAASLLFGILLITVMIYVFRAGAKTNETYENSQALLQLEAYNSKFEVFDNNSNTLLDLVSVINLAYDVNESVDYDSQTAVKIEIIIGTKKLEVSNTNRLTERNRVFFNGTEESIYDILNKKISELGVISASSLEKITDVDMNGDDKFEENDLSVPWDPTISDDDTFNTTKYNSRVNKTIPKYIFRAKSEETKYDTVTGKIIYMKFVAGHNPEYYKQNF